MISKKLLHRKTFIIYNHITKTKNKNESTLSALGDKSLS